MRRVTRQQGVFMISVAAELAEMHPQTLRMYEQRGLISPKRSPKGTRLYSQDDVERLRRIQELTCELGMNLAGVERVFELEAQIERMAARLRALEERGEALRAEMESELEEVRRSFRAEIVRYEAPGMALVPVRRSLAPALRLRRRQHPHDEQVEDRRAGHRIAARSHGSPASLPAPERVDRPTGRRRGSSPGAACATASGRCGGARRSSGRARRRGSRRRSRGR